VLAAVAARTMLAAVLAAGAPPAEAEQPWRQHPFVCTTAQHGLEQRELLLGLSSEQSPSLRAGNRATFHLYQAYARLLPLAMHPTFTNVADDDKLAQGTAGVEWTHRSDAQDVYGVDEDGWARVPWDDVGVQYGLEAVRTGRLTREEFLRVNACVGGWKRTRDMVAEGAPFQGPLTPATFDPWSSRNMTLSPGGTRPAPRTAGDVAAIEGAFGNGHVFRGDVDIPIMDWRHHLEHELDMHNSHQSFAVRQRMLDADGDAGNHVIWFSDARPARASDQTTLALDVLQDWITAIKANPRRGVAGNRPAAAVDTCFATDGSVIHAGADAWAGILDGSPAGPCPARSRSTRPRASRPVRPSPARSSSAAPRRSARPSRAAGTGGGPRPGPRSPGSTRSTPRASATTPIPASVRRGRRRPARVDRVGPARGRAVRDRTASVPPERSGARAACENAPPAVPDPRGSTTDMLKDLLRTADLTPADLEVLLDLSAHLKAEPHAEAERLRNETVGVYFNKPSTRTRLSVQTAVTRLGGTAQVLGGNDLQLGRGETIEDTAAVMSRFLQAFVIRTFADSDVARFAAAADIPVVNALTDGHHPLQSLADLLTMRERFGELRGLRLAYLGDGNNVTHSLMEAGALAGMTIAVGVPAGYEPDAEVVRRAEALAAANGGAIEVTNDPLEAVRGAHAVYTDVWLSMGDPEEERARRLADLDAFRVTPGLMGEAHADGIFLHCLPAHRGEEVDAAVIDGERSLVFDQAGNRLPTVQAVLVALLDRRLEGAAEG
jgi:ornithine carbamoyltransferase